jgi:AcrR family transcriptional regulator
MPSRGRPITLSEDSLLDAARDLFLERGLDATTVEIADRASISESVIFHRYKTKEALFLAVFDRQVALPAIFERLASMVGKGEIEKHLFVVGSSLIELSQAVLPFMMMAFSSPTKLPQGQERCRQPHPVRMKMIRLLSGYFRAELRLGRLRAVNPEILVRAYLGAVQHYVMSEFLERSFDPLPLAGEKYATLYQKPIADAHALSESHASQHPEGRAVPATSVQRSKLAS